MGTVSRPTRPARQARRLAFRFRMAARSQHRGETEMTCEACGADLSRVRTGRPRRFCSSACRVRAHRNSDVTKLALRSSIVTDLAQLAATGKRFGVILADPPWRFETYSEKGKDRSAENHYPTKTLDE